MPTLPAQVRQLHGLALPAQRTPAGYFGVKGELDVAWGELLLALFTPIGSRPFARTFGSALGTLIFEANIVQNAPTIEYVVQTTAEQWVPSVVVTGVLVLIPQSTDTVNRTVDIEVSFRLAGSNEISKRAVRVTRDDAIQATKVSIP
jgi:phage baseplate assembly protein W